jgi:hypothetical protein
MSPSPDPFASDFAEGPSLGPSDLIKAELEPGELLLWSSLSIPGRFQIGPGEYGCLTFVAIFFSGFAWFCRSAYSSELNKGLSLYLGTLLGFVGLWLAGMVWIYISDSLRDLRRRNHCLYALTDRRAILWVIVPGRPREVYSISRGKITNVHRLENADGSGDVIFNVISGFHAFRSSGLEVTSMPRGFEAVEKVRQVEALVRQTLIIETGEAEGGSP